MTLQSWRPFADPRRHTGFSSRFGFPFTGVHPGMAATPGARHGDWRIPLDVVDQSGDLIVSASVPGIDPADIKVNIDDGVLTIRAETSGADDNGEHAESEYLRRERRTGSFSRALQLPDTVDQEKVTSEYAHGVLTITLPMSEATRAREITVKVA
jgi:HSP20 family protein